MISDDLVGAADRSRTRFGIGQFEPVESRLAREGTAMVLAGALKTERIGLAHSEGHHGITPEGVMVVEILVAHRHAEDALTQQGGHGGTAATLKSIVGEDMGVLVY